MQILSHIEIHEVIRARYPDLDFLRTVTDRLDQDDPFSEYWGQTERGADRFFSYDPGTATLDRNDYAGNRLESHQL